MIDAGFLSVLKWLWKVLFRSVALKTHFFFPLICLKSSLVEHP